MCRHKDKVSIRLIYLSPNFFFSLQVCGWISTVNGYNESLTGAMSHPRATNGTRHVSARRGKSYNVHTSMWENETWMAWREEDKWEKCHKRHREMRVVKKTHLILISPLLTWMAFATSTSHFSGIAKHVRWHWQTHSEKWITGLTDVSTDEIVHERIFHQIDESVDESWALSHCTLPLQRRRHNNQIIDSSSRFIRHWDVSG